jgi:anti-sigma-K factor RskA
MPDEHVQMLAEGFVLGTLTKTESESFARRLAACEPAASEAFEDARALMLALPFALPQQNPPAHLKEKILRTVSAEQSPKRGLERERTPASVRALPQRTFRQSMVRSLAWAAVFLLFAVGYGYWNQQKRLGLLLAERAELQRQISEQQKNIEALQYRIALHVELEKTLQRPKRLVIALNATKPGHAATGAALVDRERVRGYFMTDKLPALAANQDYQLWYIGKAGPVDAGVFQVDAQGYGVIEIRNLPQNLSEIQAFAVTLEPKGGSVKPTLEQMVLLGQTG